MNGSSELLKYLSTCDKEQIKEAILALPKDQQILLAEEVCGLVADLLNQLNSSLDENLIRKANGGVH